MFHRLDSGSRLLRIYRPDPYEQTATGFRSVGPIGRFDHHQKGLSCGILYAGFSLSCCLVECFGDSGVINLEGRQLAFLLTTRPLLLLELRANGAMRAGSVAALSSCADRDLSQQWSRHFHATYPQADGLIYRSAHNEESAVALYEQAEQALQCVLDLPLNHLSLRGHVIKAALDHAMLPPV